MRILTAQAPNSTGISTLSIVTASRPRLIPIFRHSQKHWYPNEILTYLSLIHTGIHFFHEGSLSHFTALSCSLCDTMITHEDRMAKPVFSTGIVHFLNIGCNNIYYAHHSAKHIWTQLDCFRQ